MDPYHPTVDIQDMLTLHQVTSQALTWPNNSCNNIRISSIQGITIDLQFRQRKPRLLQSMSTCRPPGLAKIITNSGQFIFLETVLTMNHTLHSNSNVGKWDICRYFKTLQYSAVCLFSAAIWQARLRFFWQQMFFGPFGTPSLCVVYTKPQNL